jgi:hypothetical protein
MSDRVSDARLLLWLAFAPDRLLQASVDAAIRSQPGPLGTSREAELRTALHSQFGGAISAIRRNLLRSFCVVFGAIAAAIATGSILYRIGVDASADVESGLQYFGIAILLWATLGRVGWAVQTMDGGTLPERVDSAVYSWLYVVGSFALALPIAL